MRLHLNLPDSRGGRQFRMDQVDVEAGHQVARETGTGYEFWRVRCGRCGEIFGAVVHRTVLGTACAHCDSLQLITIEEREEVRMWRRLQAGPN